MFNLLLQPDIEAMGDTVESGTRHTREMNKMKDQMNKMEMMIKRLNDELAKEKTRTWVCCLNLTQEFSLFSRRRF